MIQSLTGWIHTIAATLALVFGSVIFARRKGTLVHKVMGYAYTAAMIVLIATAFSIYHLTHSFNFLHIAAVISCPPLALGLAAAVTRRPRGGWLVRHYYWMSWSYIGLCAAFMAEITTRLIMPWLLHHYGWRSPWLFWGIVGGASSVVTSAGWFLVERNRKLAQPGR